MILQDRVPKTGGLMTNAGTGENDNRAEAPTILVVEDEVLIRLAVSDYLRDCGYRVVETGSGDEAVTILTKTDVRIDVVFTDVSMPGGLNGFGLAQWVRRERPDVRVILASGVTRTAEEARDLCAHGLFMGQALRPPRSRSPDQGTSRAAVNGGALTPTCDKGTPPRCVLPRAGRRSRSRACSDDQKASLCLVLSFSPAQDAS